MKTDYEKILLNQIILSFYLPNPVICDTININL